MKKVLLATTALVAATGFAMADVSLSGSAEMGIASSASIFEDVVEVEVVETEVAVLGEDGLPTFEEDGTTPITTTITTLEPVIVSRVVGYNDGDMHVYSGVSLDITFSGTTDNGLTFGASMDAETSSSDFDPGDWEFDTPEAALGFGSVWISSGGLTVTADDNGIDNLYDSDSAHDLQIDYAAGAVSFSATSDVDGNSGASDPADESAFSFSVSYDQDGISASLAGDDRSDCTVLNFGYAAGAFSVGLEADQGCGDGSVNTLSASFSADAVTLSAEVADDDSWEVGATFSQDGVSVSALTDSSSYLEFYGSVDMGGGASMIAGFNSDDAYYLGAALTF